MARLCGILQHGERERQALVQYYPVEGIAVADRLPGSKQEHP